MNKKKAARALATCAAALGLATGVTNSAQAQAGYTDGYVQLTTEVVFVNCGGAVQFGTSDSNGSLYARGVFTLNLSSRARECQGWLQRSTNKGASWTTISGIHHSANGEVQYTDYYWDSTGYMARVCVGDMLYSNSYSCGPGV
ncbi:hypothetical protein [Streptomyces sp. NBC_01198]|uniref:hypothetical protein n=1 Tax=Streptomyces sp. NBC_01198 TaxID=2903769 RepID=UPI002E12B881|nr:hypothetical protein OG702_14620 [Streptomyces sp. NBC_01198]